MMGILVFGLWATGTATAAPLVCEFETEGEAAAWAAAGPSANAAVTRDAEHVREGEGALLCTYTGAAGSPFSLTRGELDIAEATSLSLSLKASSQSPFVLSLSEEDGSVYHTFLTCPGGPWYDIALPLSDFQLQDGSQDENEALDADQVRTFVVQELANMPGELGGIFGTKTGEQALAVDAVAFAAQNVPSRSRAAAGKVEVDGFERPWFQALAVGGAQLSHVPGNDGGEPSALGIRFTFQPAGAQQWPGVVLPIGHADLTGARSMRLRVRSPGPLNVHVLLEEQDGSRYEARRTLPEGVGWQARDFPLADFTLDPTRTDENGALDAGQLRVVVIVVDSWNALLDEDERGQFAVDDVLFLTAGGS